MKHRLVDNKIKLRKKQFILRKNLYSLVKNSFNEKLFINLSKKIKFEKIKFISSFISINSEIDTQRLNNYILKENKILCLPVVSNKDEHLIFRKFTNNKDMVKGFMNIDEPSSKNAILTPEVLFVPCLAFDKFGYRLGYGGGYYDRTFTNLKKNKKNFISIGYAFDGQKVAEVPRDKFDIKLDYVITEKKIYNFI